MLRTELIELINSGEAWAFVGSGASGSITWERLVEQVVDGLNEEGREAVNRDRGFERARLKADFAHCFSVIESMVGRRVLERLVLEALSPVSRPGLLAQYLADWPFRGYITTNYDDVLESALAGLRQRGWIAVGNTDSEVRKVASDASEVVWHVHGSLNLDPAASRLILTDQDYDSLYLGETTVSRQLSGLLAQRRIVFFGLAFRTWK